MINHSYQDDSDITADYTQIDAKDLRDAMQKIENHILSENIKDIILSREYLTRIADKKMVMLPKIKRV